MDLSKRYSGLWNGWPVRAARAVVVQGARPVWTRAIGASLTEGELRRRDSERARQKAELGAAIVRESEVKKDTRLRHWGGATLAMAMANVHDRPDDMVTRKAVTEVVAPHLDSIADNPYVDPVIADKVTAVLQESGEAAGGQTK